MSTASRQWYVNRVALGWLVGLCGAIACVAEAPDRAQSSSERSAAPLTETPAAVAEVCPPCPLLQAMQLRGEATPLGCDDTDCTLCSNGTCDPGENHDTCGTDCPRIPSGPVCGNGACEAGETSSCPIDCGSPAPQCGNTRCEAGERDTCPEDCCIHDDPPCPV